MPNEIRHIGHATGLTLTADVITPAGVLRDEGINLTETPPGKRHYLGSCASIVVGDAVIILNGAGIVMGGYVYDPLTVADIMTQITEKIIECDSFFDMTKNPWQLVVCKKGDIQTEYSRKNAYDKDGNPVTSVTQVIAYLTEPQC
jgi:hypothetical protein